MPSTTPVRSIRVSLSGSDRSGRGGAGRRAAEDFSVGLAAGIAFFAVLVLLGGLGTRFSGDTLDLRLSTFVGFGRAVTRRSEEQGGQLGRVCSVIAR